MASVTGIDFSQEPRRLVKQIERQGIRDAALLDAMGAVPREALVPPDLHEFACPSAPLPNGNKQTNSQPLIVALMATALECGEDDRVLEVGTAWSCAPAVPSRVAREVSLHTLLRAR